MPFSLGAQSRAFSTRVDPALLGLVPLALTFSAVDFGMTEEQSRTEAEQRKKVQQGYLKKMKSVHVIVAPAKFSKGLDLVPWIDKKFQ